MSNRESTSPSGENDTQPPFYTDLFDGFTGIASENGIPISGPLDSSLPEGLDGTITPDGKPAFGYKYTVPVDDIHPSLTKNNVDGMEIESFSATIVGEDIWPETLEVTFHESIGLSKIFRFEKETNSKRITANVRLQVDEPSGVKVGRDLTKEQKDEIIDATITGDNYFLGAEGQVGDFARSLHLAIQRDPDLEIDDTELLLKALDFLKN